MARVLLVLVAVLAVVAVLGFLHVIPLPFGLASRDAESGGSLGDGFDASDPGGKDAVLQGGGRKPKAAEPVAPPAPPVPSDVAGSVPKGGLVRGRVVKPGDPPVPI